MLGLAQNFFLYFERGGDLRVFVWVPRYPEQANFYKFKIIVSVTIVYVFIRIHFESFNVVYEPCHGETRLRH